MIYIAICDDNKKSVEVLENKVSAWLKENHKMAKVHTYTIAICDDNKKSVEVLENKVSAWLKENHKMAKVHTYTESQMLQYDIEEG